MDGGNTTTRDLVYIVFDVIYLDGQNAQQVLNNCAPMVPPAERKPGSITSLPLRARRDILESIVEEESKKLELIRHVRVEDTEADIRLEKLMNAFDDALQVNVFYICMVFRFL